MGAMQRRKGATFEREVANDLTTELGWVIKRRLGQARDSGHDLTQVGPFVIECKRYARIAVYEWLEQAARACSQVGDVPTVIARADGKDAIAIVYLKDFVPLMRGELGDSR